jgi:hypothetical protein
VESGQKVDGMATNTEVSCALVSGAAPEQKSTHAIKARSRRAERERVSRAPEKRHTHDIDN